MVAGKLHTIDHLLAPYDGKSEATAGPAPLSRAQAHAHDSEYWWHEPEWLHRLCCES